MGYVTNRDGRWYAVSYEGLDPVTGRDRRRCIALMMRPMPVHVPMRCRQPDRPRRAGSPCRDTCALVGSRPARTGCGRPLRSGTRK
jgi:hypothetical protein